MRICPQCNTRYTDDSLQFCLQDGTQLPDPVGDPYETTDLDEPETVLSQKPTNKISFDLTEPEQQTREKIVPFGAVASQPAEKSSKTWIAVLLTAIGMSMLFGIVAAVAWFYLVGQPSSTEQAGSSEQAGKNSRDSDEKLPVPSPSPRQSPGRSPSPSPSPTPNQTETPTAVDRKKTVREVSAQMSSWKRLAEARNLRSYMRKYASKLDYYNKRGASKSFVEADKRRAFRKYTSIRYRFSNIRITPSKDGKRATAVYDKEWSFSGSGARDGGKVRSQLIFRKVGNSWLIVSERDLKVYYVNKG